MSKDVSVPNPADFGLTSFADLLPKRVSGLGDGEQHFAGFRARLLRDLGPETPYEFVVAESIVAIEWEMLQERRIRDRAVARYLEAAVKQAHLRMLEAETARTHTDSNGSDAEHAEAADSAASPSEQRGDSIVDISSLLEDAGSSDPAVSVEAQELIRMLGIDLLDLMGEARLTFETGVSRHDGRVQELERRRRQVKRDYDALVRARPIDQAEVIDGD